MWLLHPKSQFIGYLKGEMTPAAAARVGAHLGSCARCRHEFAGLRQVGAALAAGLAPAPRPPRLDRAAFRAGVYQKIAAAQRAQEHANAYAQNPMPRRLRIRHLAAAAVAATAVLALGATVFHSDFPMPGGAGEATINAGSQQVATASPNVYPVVEHLDLLENLDVIENLDKLAPNNSGGPENQPESAPGSGQGPSNSNQRSDRTPQERANRVQDATLLPVAAPADSGTLRA